jgi:hypothetical protein
MYPIGSKLAKSSPVKPNLVRPSKTQNKDRSTAPHDSAHAVLQTYYEIVSTTCGCPCRFFASWTDFTRLGLIRLVRQQTRTAGKSIASTFVGQHIKWGTRWHSWFRLQAGFVYRWYHWNFLLTYPSGLTMALGSTQPLTEMSTRNISQPVRRADMCLLS